MTIKEPLYDQNRTTFIFYTDFKNTLLKDLNCLKTINQHKMKKELRKCDTK